MSKTLRYLDSNPSKLEQIWAEYAIDRDLVRRNALIVAYQSLVTRAVRRLPAQVQAYWDHDELRSFGQDGLVKAIERWEGGPAKFEAYAVKRIRGAIFDEFRRLDWVPRGVRERLSAYRSTQDRLTHDLGRTPSHQEILFAMGVEEKQGGELLAELRAAQFLHLSAVADGDAQSDQLEDVLKAVDEPESEVVGASLADDLERATASLLPREQAIIHLAFVAGLSQDQIGDIIGVSGSQVCKLQGRALRKLRTVLEPAYLDDEELAATA